MISLDLTTEEVLGSKMFLQRLKDGKFGILNCWVLLRLTGVLLRHKGALLGSNLGQNSEFWWGSWSFLKIFPPGLSSEESILLLPCVLLLFVGTLSWGSVSAWPEAAMPQTLKFTVVEMTPAANKRPLLSLPWRSSSPGGRFKTALFSCKWFYQLTGWNGGKKQSRGHKTEKNYLCTQPSADL